MSGAISATDGSVIITMEYNPADVDGVGPGLAWCIIHDNPTIGWTLATPVAPIILGTMPGAAPATDPVLSPTWAQYVGGTVFVPDLWRGSLMELFHHLSSNNGAQRKLYAKFYSMEVGTAFSQWAQLHPNLALTEPPNVTAARLAEERKAEAEAKAATAAEAKTAADEAKAAADAARKTGAPRADKS